MYDDGKEDDALKLEQHLQQESPEGILGDGGAPCIKADDLHYLPLYISS